MTTKRFPAYITNDPAERPIYVPDVLIRVAVPGDRYRAARGCAASLVTFRDGEAIGWTDTRALGFENARDWRAYRSPCEVCDAMIGHEDVRAVAGIDKTWLCEGCSEEMEQSVRDAYADDFERGIDWSDPRTYGEAE